LPCVLHAPHGNKGIRLSKKDSMCDLKLQWDCYKSVARIRLVKIENPSGCVTVNCNSYSAVLPVVPSCVNKVSRNPIQNPPCKSRAKPLTHDSMFSVR
jgi:hypothetical protein